MSEAWCHVAIYGRENEIERFKELFIVPDVHGFSEESDLTIDFYRVLPTSSYGSVTPWNFRGFDDDDPNALSFAFDFDYDFPHNQLRGIAQLFPTLAFDCDCIDGGDAFMGFGWFNTPPGGEDFAQRYRVPKDYWTGQGACKREPEAEERYLALVKKLKSDAREEDERQRRIAAEIRESYGRSPATYPDGHSEH